MQSHLKKLHFNLEQTNKRDVIFSGMGTMLHFCPCATLQHEKRNSMEGPQGFQIHIYIAGLESDAWKEYLLYQSQSPDE